MTRGNIVLLTRGMNIARGKIVLITRDYNGRHFYMSTEFNGDMYPEGHGEEIIKKFESGEITETKDFYNYIEDFNKRNFGYDDDWIVGEIKPNNCMNNLYDLSTWQYHSDYLYMLNISGEDIEVAAKNGVIKIDDGGYQIFNFGRVINGNFLNPQECTEFTEKALIYRWANADNHEKDEAELCEIKFI